MSAPTVRACDSRRPPLRGISLLLVAMATAAVLTIAVGCGETTDHRSARGASAAGPGTSVAMSVSASPASSSEASGDDEPERGRNPEYGQMLYANTCTTCHGARAQGMPHQGVNLRTSKFVAAQSDHELVAFLKVGRKPEDPRSLQKLLMPPRGGNANLDDTSLGDIVAFLRQVQSAAKQEDVTPEGANPASTQPVATITPAPAATPGG